MEMLENRMATEPLLDYISSDEYDKLMNALAEKEDERWENEND